MTWPPENPWYDAIVMLAMAAAATSHVRLGLGVLVLPLRHPVVVAKQLASLDALSEGRLVVGVGAGWLAEEFEALRVPYAARGRLLDEWIELLRACWTGRPGAFAGERYRLPSGVLCYPTPVHDLPVAVGGVTPAALRRAARLGSGWVALQRADDLDPDQLARAIGRLRAMTAEAGRDPNALEVILLVVESAGRTAQVSRVLPALVRAGVTEIVVETRWDDQDGIRQVHDTLRAAIASR
jgi:probable F420-dependent oxidoreductase